MATIKQRHKAELKALNLDCETRLQGKKGPERAAELKVIETLKKELQERQEKELREEEERLAAQAEAKQQNGEEGDEIEEEGDDKSGEKGEKKLSRARQRAMKKEAREEEEKKKRQEEAAKRGPTKRDVEEATLTAELARLGLRIRDITPDGNCMFTAVSDQVKVREGLRYDIQDLRMRAIKEMKEHPAMFAPFLPEGETLDKYCAKMAKSGEWGGELELRALSLALQRQIWVHSFGSPTIRWGEDEGFDPSTALHLTYHQHQFALGEHYNSAVPDSLKD